MNGQGSLKAFSSIVPWLSTPNLLMALSTYQMKTFALAVTWISESQRLPIWCVLFSLTSIFLPMQTQPLCSILTKKNIPVLLQPPISGIPTCLSRKLQLRFYIRPSKALGKLGLLNHFFLICFGLGSIGQYRVRCAWEWG